MHEKFPIIKNRDQCDYRFDYINGSGFSGANYLPDNDDFSMIFFGTM